MDRPITFYDAPGGNPIEHFTQWDTGQTIYAEKWDTTIEPIFYFSSKSIEPAKSVKGVFTGNYISVDVPNIMFVEAETMVVRVYQFSDADSAKTLYIARIPVEDAVKPDEYEYIENYTEISVTDLSRRVYNLETAVSALTKRVTALETNS